MVLSHAGPYFLKYVTAYANLERAQKFLKEWHGYEMVCAFYKAFLKTASPFRRKCPQEGLLLTRFIETLVV